MPEIINNHADAFSGVTINTLIENHDSRGSFTEFYREQWIQGPRSVQFNLVKSKPGTLRGIHVHIRHHDYLVVTTGVMYLCLGDLRKASQTFGLWDVVVLDSSLPQSAIIPPGVAHGFYFSEYGSHLYGMSEYWNPEEEMGCHWADPSLNIAWPVEGQPILSVRDTNLGPLNELLQKLDPYQHSFNLGS